MYLAAGFYPATVFYLSLFYTRYEFAQRLGMFYGQSAVAGAFGGLVSYFVFKLFPSGSFSYPIPRPAILTTSFRSRKRRQNTPYPTAPTRRLVRLPDPLPPRSRSHHNSRIHSLLLAPGRSEECLVAQDTRRTSLGREARLNRPRGSRERA